MRLFVDKLPLVKWTNQTVQPSVDHLLVGLEILPSNDRLEPVTDQAQLWFVDTGFPGEAIASGYHLDLAKIAKPKKPQILPVSWSVAQHNPKSSGQKPTKVPLWPTDLWLVTNAAGQNERLFYLGLNEGVGRYDGKIIKGLVPYYQQRISRALIGTRALKNAKLKLEVDFDTLTVSIWVPEGESNCFREFEVEHLRTNIPGWPT